MVSQPARITVPYVRSLKSSANPQDLPLVALTAYDFSFARLIDQSGVDIVLVGDSLGMVIQGESTTLPVTLEQMIYHTRCVSRGIKRALLVADMPFLSYQPSLERAIDSAGRLIKEGGAAAVKLEGGVAIAQTVKRLVELDIAVMGHVGMTPQSIHRMGGFRQQGKVHREKEKFLPGSYEQIVEDARAIEEAGAFSLVLEAVSPELAKVVTGSVSIPVIGIAAGNECDGQILVSYDLLGITYDLCPPFVKPLASIGATALDALTRYSEQVRSSHGRAKKKGGSKR